MISSVISIILLVIFGILSFFMELVALNGYGEKEGGAALIAFGICQVLGLLLCVLFAGWLTKLLITRFTWNKTVTVIVSVLAAIIVSGGLGMISFLISVIVAEGLR